MTLREWLARGPFALALSSSYFGFFAHGGAWRALSAAGLEPAHLSGASAGAIVAAAWASGLEADDYLAAIAAVERRDVWDPRPGAGILRGRRFRDRLGRLLRVARVEDCRIPLALSVFDVLRLRTRVVRAGPLADAVHASCAVPLMFHPVRLGRWCWDGGVRDPGALAGVPQGLRVLQIRIAPKRRGPPRVEIGGERATLVITDHRRPGLFGLSRGPAAAAAGEEATARALARRGSFR